MKAVDFLAAGVASEDLPISYRNCCVATASETIVGSANVFPTDALKNEDYAFVPSDRIDHIRSMLELQDWGSMFLNTLAVSEAHRGSGIGIRLLGWARTRAREAGFDRLSLHVWADNTSALRFYEAQGFVRQGVAKVPTHPRLPRKGGSILMRQIISAGAAHPRAFS
jgi:ribosomal protein S18 acetylase RimI-like enzyme